MSRPFICMFGQAISNPGSGEEDVPLDEKKQHTVGRVNQKGAADELCKTIHLVASHRPKLFLLQRCRKRSGCGRLGVLQGLPEEISDNDDGRHRRQPIGNVNAVAMA